MALNWGIAFLSSVVVFSSVWGDTDRNCDSGPKACRGAIMLTSDGQGNTLCCPAGFSMSEQVISINGVTTRNCTCSQGTDNSSSIEVVSGNATSNSSVIGQHWQNLQDLFQDFIGDIF